jgi:hypothetical protein
MGRTQPVTYFSLVTGELIRAIERLPDHWLE